MNSTVNFAKSASVITSNLSEVESGFHFHVTVNESHPIGTSMIVSSSYTMLYDAIEGIPYIFFTVSSASLGTLYW